MDKELGAAPESKVQLLELIEEAHSELERTMGLLNQEQIVEPGLEGGWSVKDVLSHISACSIISGRYWLVDTTSTTRSGASRGNATLSGVPGAGRRSG